MYFAAHFLETFRHFFRAFHLRARQFVKHFYGKHFHFRGSLFELRLNVVRIFFQKRGQRREIGLLPPPRAREDPEFSG